jgi:hypothetical protein
MTKPSVTTSSALAFASLEHLVTQTSWIRSRD